MHRTSVPMEDGPTRMARYEREEPARILAEVVEVLPLRAMSEPDLSSSDYDALEIFAAASEVARERKLEEVARAVVARAPGCTGDGLLGRVAMNVGKTIDDLEPYVVQLFASSDPRLRWWALEILASSSRLRAIEGQLLDAALADREAMIRLKAIGQIKATAMNERIRLQALAVVPAGWEAAEARVNHSRCVSHLEGMCEDPDPRVVASAKRALESVRL